MTGFAFCLILTLGLCQICTTGANHISSEFHKSAMPTFQRASQIEPIANRFILRSNISSFDDDEVPLPGQLTEISQKMKVSLLHLDDEVDVQDVKTQLEAHPRVEYFATDDIIWTTSVATPDDPQYRFQWGLPRVHADAAWGIIQKENLQAKNMERRVTVCVTDSGVDASHQDLKKNLNTMPGYNAITKTDNPEDGLSHGTHVAGIIAAEYNNNADISGVTLNQVDVLSCKFINDNGFGYTSDAIACIDYCIDQGADIITNSWSGGEKNPAMFNAIEEAESRGILFVVASGNLGLNLDVNATYPAGYGLELSNMLVVASTGYKDGLSGFSNYGNASVHIAAPGEWILSTVPDDKTAYYSGTSMAAPLVAGAAGLVLAATNGTVTPMEVKQILIDTAEHIPSLDGKVESQGILRADLALEAALVIAKERRGTSAPVAESPQNSRRLGRKLTL